MTWNCNRREAFFKHFVLFVVQTLIVRMCACTPLCSIVIKGTDSIESERPKITGLLF